MNTRYRTVTAAAIVVALGIGTAGCGRYSIGSLRAQKAYKDFNTSWPLNSWSVTENSNGYQVAYIRLLSKFVK